MNMQMRVAAKGVETYQDLLLLQSHWCPGGQDRNFSQPLGAIEVTELLAGIARTKYLLT